MKIKNVSIFTFIFRYYVKDADPGLECDENCLRSKLCDIATSQAGDATQCNTLLQEFQQNK